LSFVVRWIRRSICARRAFDLIGPIPFDAERPLALDAGLATVARLAVVVRFFVVAIAEA